MRVHGLTRATLVGRDLTLLVLSLDSESDFNIASP
jgi:hypothetical protein